MKIFLSWSGERSQIIAEALRDWLPKVIQAIEPWMSALDIDRGARWSSDIAAELELTKFGILCLTPENLDAPWIHFEAGALSKTIEKTLVCPYIFELEPTDLKGPLVQFNAAKANKTDTRKLVLTINEAQDIPLSENTIKESFEIWWLKLEDILKNLPQQQTQDKYERPERELLEEILDLVREQIRDSSSKTEFDLVESVTDEDDTDHTQKNVRFIPGSRVVHAKYGKGMVIKRQGAGENATLLINFPGFGQKKLMEKFTTLEKAS